MVSPVSGLFAISCINQIPPRGVHHAESGGGDGIGGGDEGAEGEAGLPVERNDETVGENGDADDGEGDENARSTPPQSGMSREEIPK